MQLDKVTFAYRRRRPILHGITWTVPTTGRTVLLGPNGAGKSTLLRLLAGASKPTSGTVRILGPGGREGSLRSNVAWMPQQVTAVRGLRVRDQVALAAWLGGMTSKRAESAANETIQRLSLNHLADKHVETLSGGQLRRVGLAEAMVRQVGVVLLDEPTAGLDPSQRQGFRSLLAQSDASLIVSTHELDDIDEVYDHVVVLVSGRIVFSGTRQDFYASVPDKSSPTAAQVFSHFVPSDSH